MYYIKKNRILLREWGESPAATIRGGQHPEGDKYGLEKRFLEPFKHRVGRSCRGKCRSIPSAYLTPRTTHRRIFPSRTPRRPPWVPVHRYFEAYNCTVPYNWCTQYSSGESLILSEIRSVIISKYLRCYAYSLR